MPRPNDPSLVRKALAKAQSLETRIDSLAGQIGPQLPTLLHNLVTTVVQQTVDGTYTWVCPAGVTQARVQAWGAGAGGDGGGASAGGAGGGGGAYSEEPAYQLVPGTTYTYIVGNGGTGGITGNQGTDGGDSSFDADDAGNLGTAGTGGVFASGGSASASSSGGAGGLASTTQAIEFAGGKGGGDGTQSTGGCGGGSSASPTANGSNGANSTTSTGAAGGAGGTDKGAGGAGGNSAANGVSGSSPGGGGGGCGAASGVSTVNLTWSPTDSCTYYGSDAIGGNANQKRTSAGTHMFQGGTTASGGSYNGTQKAIMLLPPTVASDLTGVTIDSCTLTMTNTGTFYSNGVTVKLGFGVYPSLGPAYGGAGLTDCKTYNVASGVAHTQDLTSSTLPAALKNGTATGLVLGLVPAYNGSYFGQWAGAGVSSGYPVLSVTGHTGAAQAQAGNGADGKVKITYALPTTALASVQPAAVTDDYGNQLPAGFMGQMVAVKPGSDPAVAEAWIQPTLQNSWSNASGNELEYKLGPDNRVYLHGRLTAGASVTGGPTLLATVTSAYYPSRDEPLYLLGHNATSPYASFMLIALVRAATGNIDIFGSYNNGQNLEIQGSYPLDA